MLKSEHLIEPDWACSPLVRSYFTTRIGGVSRGGYKSLNVATHVGDDRDDVAENRQRLRQYLPSDPVWMNQQHTSICVNVDLLLKGTDRVNADASFTRTPWTVLAVQVADCLPVLLSARDGSVVSVIHAGWRGLAEGIIANTIEALGDVDLIAWLGPAIGVCHYEVGADVRTRFPQNKAFQPSASERNAFEPKGARWMMDLYSIAGEQLSAMGVTLCSGGCFCSQCDDQRFFSYRRDGTTGRMAGLIWIAPPTQSR